MFSKKGKFSNQFYETNIIPETKIRQTKTLLKKKTLVEIPLNTDANIDTKVLKILTKQIQQYIKRIIHYTWGLFQVCRLPQPLKIIQNNLLYPHTEKELHDHLIDTKKSYDKL